jgi:membrane-bound metal-dependent hydrolase YbcI (DUF457 family)
MMAKAHMVSGWCAGAGYAYLTGRSDPGSVLTCGGIGAGLALLPDLDCGSSTVTKMLGPVGWALSHILRGCSHALYAVTKGPRDEDCQGEHRHASHTLLFAVLVGWLAYAGLVAAGSPDAAFYAGAAAVGCFAHCLGDSLTVSGCPWLFPLMIRGETWYEIRILGPLSFHTNGGWEKAFWTPAFMLLAIRMCPGVWPEVVSAVNSSMS